MPNYYYTVYIYALLNLSKIEATPQYTAGRGRPTDTDQIEFLTLMWRFQTIILSVFMSSCSGSWIRQDRGMHHISSNKGPGNNCFCGINGPGNKTWNIQKGKLGWIICFIGSVHPRIMKTGLIRDCIYTNMDYGTCYHLFSSPFKTMR